MNRIFKGLITTFFVIVFWLAVISLSVVFLESQLRKDRGEVPELNLSPEFYYQNVEIFEPFFIKTVNSKGKKVYKCQRSTDSQDRKLENVEFPVEKGRTTKRIFIIGGSVGTQIGRNEYLSGLFKQLLPEFDFEVISCARGCYNSYTVSLVEKELLKYSPDLFIVLSGNNEYFQISPLNKFNYRIFMALQRYWFFHILQNRVRFLRRSKDAEEILNNYEKNLRLIIKRARKRNIPVVLCTLPANIRDCAPQGRPLWEKKTFLEAWRSFEKKQFNDAVKKFKKHLLGEPQDPFGNYFLARSLESLGEYPEAKKYYQEALNLDYARGNVALPPSWRRKVAERLSSQGRVIMTDLEKLFEEVSTNGIIGVSTLVDKCHWWGDYNSLVEIEIVKSIIRYNQRYPDEAVLTRIDKWRFEGLDMQEDYREFNVFNSNDVNRKAVKCILNAAAELKTDNLANYVEEFFISSLSAAYSLDPDLFNDLNKLKEQILLPLVSKLVTWEGESSVELNKSWPYLLMHFGETLRRLGEYDQALEYFDQALAMNPQLCFAYIGKAAIKKANGDKDGALEDFNQARKLEPKHPLLKYYSNDGF